MSECNTSELQISGLAELAADFPDNDWRELRVHVRKTEDGRAHIIVKRELAHLSDAYEADGELWYRDARDELQRV